MIKASQYIIDSVMTLGQAHANFVEGDYYRFYLNDTPGGIWECRLIRNRNSEITLTRDMFYFYS